MNVCRREQSARHNMYVRGPTNQQPKCSGYAVVQMTGIEIGMLDMRVVGQVLRSGSTLHIARRINGPKSELYANV